MGTPTGDMLRAASACAGMAVEASADAAKLRQRVAELEAALAWYGEQARLCRLIHSEGDAGRQALADDGGKRARDVLTKST